MCVFVVFGGGRVGWMCDYYLGGFSGFVDCGGGCVFCFSGGLVSCSLCVFPVHVGICCCTA